MCITNKPPWGFTRFSESCSFIFNCSEHMAFELQFTSVLIISSFVSYLLFNILFLAAQQWWGFAMVISAFAYIPFVYADIKGSNKSYAGWLMIHIICTFVQVAWTVFFFVEIFVNSSSIVQNWLGVYLKNSTNARDVARYAAISMSVFGAITAIVMLLCAAVVIAKLMERSEESEVSSLPSRSETLAVRMDNDMLRMDSGIPRLRATSDGNIFGVQSTGGFNTGWATTPPTNFGRHVERL